MFAWKGNKGVADRSDFTQLSGQFGPLTKPLYAKTQLQAFQVSSARTGALVTFFPVYDEDGYDGEMEVFADEENKFFITIFND